MFLFDCCSENITDPELAMAVVMAIPVEVATATQMDMVAAVMVALPTVTETVVHTEVVDSVEETRCLIWALA